MFNYTEGRLPSAESLLRIRDTYGINVDWLLTGEGTPYLPEKDVAGLPTASRPPCAIPQIIEAVAAEMGVTLNGQQMEAIVSLMEDEITSHSRRLATRLLKALFQMAE